MNILWIAPDCPYPLNSGGKIVLYNRLKYLSSFNNITLLSIIDKSSDLTYLPVLHDVCKEVKFYKKNTSVITKLKSIIYPYSVISRFSSIMLFDINNYILKNNIDIIIIESLQMLEVVRRCKLVTNIPIVINQLNIEYQVCAGIAKTKKSIIEKTIYMFESFKLKYYEKNNLNLANFQIFLSSSDLEAYIKVFKYKRVNCCFNCAGIELNNLTSNKIQTTNNCKSIVFTGTMRYPPNVESVTWFCLNVLPSLIKLYPGIIFYIIGKEPVDEVLRLKSENVVVTGEVSELEKELLINSSNLFVIPLFTGGGVKLKLFEAISFKKPIVTTSIGIEGSGVTADLVNLANTENEFINACVKVLDFQDESIELAKKAFEYIKNNYSWIKLIHDYQQLLEKVVVNKIEI